jgi:hypothetical protein
MLWNGENIAESEVHKHTNSLEDVFPTKSCELANIFWIKTEFLRWIKTNLMYDSCAFPLSKTIRCVFHSIFIVYTIVQTVTLHLYIL